MSKNFRSKLTELKQNEKEAKDKVVSVRVPSALLNRLEKIRKKEGLKMSVIILAALESAAKDYEF